MTTTQMTTTTISPHDGGIEKLEKLNRQSATAIFMRLNGRSVEAVVEKGKLILRAKAELPHAHFTPWLSDDLGFGEKNAATNKAAMHTAIAQHAVLSDSENWCRLPSSYRALYELTLCEEDFLIACLNAGRVHHDMTIQDAEELKTQSRSRRSNANGSNKTPPRQHNRNNNAVPELAAPLVALALGLMRVQPKQTIIQFLTQFTGIPAEQSDNELDDALAFLKKQQKKMRGA